jgi:hypothetical protein
MLFEQEGIYQHLKSEHQNLNPAIERKDASRMIMEDMKNSQPHLIILMTGYYPL